METFLQCIQRSTFLYTEVTAPTQAFSPFSFEDALGECKTFLSKTS